MGQENQQHGHFDKLLREGSESSRAKNDLQTKGAFPVWLLVSFLVSLVFPLFWIVFVVLLCGGLVYWGREWMG